MRVAPYRGSARIQGMSRSLAEQSCQTCTRDSEPVAAAKAQDYLAQLPGWEIVSVNGVQQLQKVYTVKPYARTLAFAMALGELAERHNHHPAMLLEWGKLRVNWWTHVLGGLHLNDFILAAQTDALFDDTV